jgi:signal transduction histidine kinase
VGSRERLSPSASLVRSAAADVAMMLRETLEAEEASVRVAVPDAGGRLRVIANEGRVSTPGPRRSALRREVFDTGRSFGADIVDDGDRLDGGSQSLSILPLTAGDEIFGVVEVVAPKDRLAGRRLAILALLRQSGALMKLSRERLYEDRSARGMERLLLLATALDQAHRPVDAMTIVADICHEYLGAPTAIVKPDRDGHGWFLAAVAGIGSRKRAHLRRVLRTVPHPDVNDEGHHWVTTAFQVAAGRRVTAFPAADAIVLVAGSQEDSRFARMSSLMLARTLDFLTGRTRGDHVRIGIAWAAHELRGPLAGAKAALEHVLSSENDGDSFALVRRTKVELEQLTDLVDPLLEWSAGKGRLDRQRGDLARIVRDAVASAALDGVSNRIRIEAPTHLPIDADVMQLRVAIANIVRNALAYSPRSSEVHVRVEDHGSIARVSVQDDGPGVRPDELNALFDPFTRGLHARNIRNGKGLGLFIARRVTEAHGGVIRVEPSATGVTFCLDLPVNGAPSPASVSAPASVSV